MIKLISGFSDYCVSDDGRVFHLRQTENSNSLCELKSYICNGHACIKLRGKKFYIDNLVAEMFLGERPNGYLIFHKNKDRLDNRVSNLVYLSPSEVQLYSTYTTEYLEEIFR